MTETLIREDFATRSQKVHQFAQNLFQSNPDWVTFFREVLGVAGAARKLFPSQQEYIAFENSEEFKRIQQMVAALRGRKGAGMNVDEPTKVITVRLPESLHEALKAEASDHNTSMNKLCISKLLQVLSQVTATQKQQRAKAATALQQRTGFPTRPQTPLAPQQQQQQPVHQMSRPVPPQQQPPRFGQRPGMGQ